MAKERAVKIGLIGAGRIGIVHGRHLRSRIGQAKLCTIADSNLSQARKLAEELGVDAVDDYHDILNDQNIEAVVICSSTDTHAKIIEESAKAGKHIFCEKPIDHELSKIDRALSAVETAGVKLQIGFNRRFDPSFKEIKDGISKGKIGKPHVLKITSRDPAPPPIEYLKVSGGMFLDMTIHDFDMARYLIGSEVVSVFATGKVRVDQKIAEVGDIDTAIVVLEFADGTVGSIDNSRQAVYGYDQRVEVFGSQGCLFAENETAHRTLLARRGAIEAPVPLDFFMTRYLTSYLNEMTAFVDCVAQDTVVPVTGQDGRVPIIMAMAARRSLTEKRLVKLSELEVKILD